ncbi:universal stress protein [Thiothrix fructosivorans]|uniref:Universal stress protein n=1 Tax=Thiothrix fructosivorans TaxID=111770 RepID=A0A8B0SM07_9GAMM|nr:universal stress protein [Thiothrix fructosivorans]MBO0611578.1 universal stress protein [Thiothrix fructosivorans]QTX10757.1 universal stress protein [Thiothrix fructosivorans]
MKPYQRILVPVDFTKISNTIVARANELANFYQAHLTLLNVLEDASLGNVAFGGTDKLGMSPVMRKNQTNLATEKLRKLADSLSGIATIALETTYASGKPSEAIIQFVKDNGIDLVVVGNSGKKSVLGFMGSTAEATLKGVPCDVMAVRIMD